MDTRVNLIMNGKRELSTVLKNLHRIFESQDKVIIYTKSEKDEFISAIKDSLHLDDSGIDAEVSYNVFNEIDYEKVKESGAKKIIGIKMPNSLFHTIAKAYNDAFKFVDKTEIARFIHAFADDCDVVEGCNYDPSAYEWFMDTFNEPFVMDSKTNPGNFAFKKYSPRFVFISPSKLKSPISFVQFESREHFIMDRLNLKEDFDGKLDRMYISEFVIRLHELGKIRHLSFYPDPIIETWVKRSDSIPFNSDYAALSEEYRKDEKYIRETLKKSIKIENSVDPIVKELSEVIETKLNSENRDENGK